MASGWFWFFGLLWAYILLIFWLIRSGKMQDWGMSLAFGFILMIRTQKGRGALDAISRPKRFWNVFGDAGIGVVLIIMAGFTFLMLLIVAPSLNPDSDIAARPANQILVIPGINPIVPLWYGLIGLIVTLVVHEGGHGVLARANQLKVKSLGLLWAIVPIGAFVEPDEDEIKEASLRKRLRVFSAGPMVNVVVGLLVLIPMVAMAGAADPLEGAALQNVVQDGPADLAGIGPGDIITSVNGTAVMAAADLGPALAGFAPGDTVNVTLHGGDVHALTLTDRWSTFTDEQRASIAAFNQDGRDLCEALYGDVPDWAACAEAAQNDPMVGVGLFGTRAWHDVLAHPLGSLGNFARLIYLPLGEVQGAPILSSYLPTFLETPFHEQTFWITFNVLFWIFWLNILVGTFNALPMLPLDGGHIFRDSLQGLLRKVRPGMESEARDRVVGKTAGFVSLGIFAIILISIIGPRVAHLWG